MIISKLFLYLDFRVEKFPFEELKSQVDTQNFVTPLDFWHLRIHESAWAQLPMRKWHTPVKIMYTKHNSKTLAIIFWKIKCKYKMHNSINVSRRVKVTCRCSLFMHVFRILMRNDSSKLGQFSTIKIASGRTSIRKKSQQNRGSFFDCQFPCMRIKICSGICWMDKGYAHLWVVLCNNSSVCTQCGFWYAIGW